jgi:uncharacterized protein (DUF4415 family)
MRKRTDEVATSEDVQPHKSRGPKPTHGPRQEVHLKFSPEVMAFIRARSPKGVQAYIDELIKREMEQREKR